MRHLFSIGVCGAMLLCANSSEASIILNGSFENNTAITSAFNMTNAGFTATVADATAFGGAGEIDLVTSTDFGIAPQSGNWKVGLHTQNATTTDAFSLALSSAIVAGTVYDLSFFGARVFTNPSVIEVGISSAANTFGTLVFSGSALSDAAWTQFSTTFVAGTNASFLTFRSGGSTLNAYSFIDNVSLDTASTPVPEPASMLLLGTGLVGMGVRRWKQRRA